MGNSVQSLGFAGGLSSGLRTLAGGEISNLTSLITEGGTPPSSAWRRRRSSKVRTE